MNDYFEDDISLLDALRSADPAGREAGYRTIYLGVGRQIRRWFVSHGATPQDAEDWLQKTILKMSRSLEQFRGDGPLKAWIWVIARRVRLSELRSEGRQPDTESLDAEREEGQPNHEVPDPGPDALESAMRRQYLECLEKAFEAFARDHPERAEVIQRIAEGEEIAEIARHKGRTPGAMREYVSQSRKKLREYSAHCREE